MIGSATSIGIMFGLAQLLTAGSVKKIRVV